MIKKIGIQNYKSILDLEIELGQVNIFIGENGCGKTNILEAIALGSAALDHKIDQEFLVVRGIRITENHLMISQFGNQEEIGFQITENDEILTDIKINLFKNTIKNERLAEQISALEQEIQDKKEYSRQVLGLDIGTHSIAWSIVDTQNQKIVSTGVRFFPKSSSLGFHIYSPENYFLRNFYEEGQIRPLGIRGEGLFKHLVEIYKQKPQVLEEIGEKLRLISWFDGFEIPQDLFFTERRINIKDKYLAELTYFDQRSANEGFLYLLFYFTLFISSATPQFFAIDNIDNALNPKLGAELIRHLTILAKENKKQVILTTHNPAILDGLDLSDPNQRLFTIYRNLDGQTQAERIKPPKNINGQNPIRLSEAFIRGYLGGLPDHF